MMMVLVQPDLGTALTYMPIAIMGLFLGGLKFKQTLVVIAVGRPDDASCLASSEALPERASDQLYGARSR